MEGNTEQQGFSVRSDSKHGKLAMVSISFNHRPLIAETLEYGDPEVRKQLANRVIDAAVEHGVIEAKDAARHVPEVVSALTADYARLVDIAAAEREKRAARKNGGDQEAEDAPPAPEAYSVSQAQLTQMPRKAVEAAEELLENADLLNLIAKDLSTVIAGEDALKKLLYVFTVSRLLRNPMSVIVTGSSSSGKSFTVNETTRLLPPEAVLRTTDLSENALVYMGENALKHRVIVAGERRHDQSEQTVDKTRMLREMISSGKLTKQTTERSESGKFSVSEYLAEGPIAFVETTTLREIFDEDQNRCIVISTDESSAQTKRIVDASDRADEDGHTGYAAFVLLKHHALHRLLHKYEVRLPFASQLGTFLKKRTSHTVETRRAYPLLKQTVKAVALLYQRQRKIVDGRLIATLEDYETARQLLDGWYQKIVAETVPESAANLFTNIEQLQAAGKIPTTFGAEHLRENNLGSRPTLYRWMSQLVDAGAASRLDSNLPTKGSAKPKASWTLVEDGLKAAASVLPTLEELTKAADAGDDAAADEPGADDQDIGQASDHDTAGDLERTDVSSSDVAADVSPGDDLTGPDEVDDWLAS